MKQEGIANLHFALNTANLLTNIRHRRHCRAQIGISARERAETRYDGWSLTLFIKFSEMLGTIQDFGHWRSIGTTQELRTGSQGRLRAKSASPLEPQEIADISPGSVQVDMLNMTVWRSKSSHLHVGGKELRLLLERAAVVEDGCKGSACIYTSSFDRHYEWWSNQSNSVVVVTYL